MEREILTERAGFRMRLMERAGELESFIRQKLPPELQRTIAPEDVLQEVFIAAHTNIERFDPDSPGAFDRWLNKIVESKTVDAIRHARRLKRGGNRRFEREVYERSTSYLDLFAHISSGGRTPSSEEAAKEAVHAVQVSLASLPDNYRTAVAMRHLQGRTHPEIAQAMGKSTTAVNALIHRGIEKMCGLLGEAGKYFKNGAG